MTSRSKSKTPARQASLQRCGAQQPSAGIKPAPPAAADEADDTPADIDEFRLDLARRMMTLKQAWRRCDQRPCRRARRCAGRDLACLQRAERPPLTPEEEARSRASMYHALQRRMAEIGADEQE